MNDDQAIKALFDAYQPKLQSRSDFEHELAQKLEVLEVVRQYQRQQLRMYRRLALISVLLGSTIGAALIALGICIPREWLIQWSSSPIWQTHALWLAVARHLDLIAYALAVGLILLGMLPIVLLERTTPTLHIQKAYM